MKYMAQALFLLFWVMAACTGMGGQSPFSVQVADSDTVAHVPTLEELTLPDTMLPSAQVIDYVVETADSMPHFLSDYVDRYDRTDRVMTFRKNLLRDADFGGTVKGTPDTIETVWTYHTPYRTDSTRFGSWGGGTGWTGQPLYAHWSEAEIKQFRQQSKALTADFGAEEVMVGSLCGKAFFLNFMTGKPSRQPLDLYNVVKGTMSLDPELMNLYSGQGVSIANPLGCQAFDLLTHQRTFFFNDQRAWRGWHAFDSSPIVAGGYLFWPGENGSLYKFERKAGGLLHRVETLRYRVHGAAPGIESCICVYRNYGFFSDNHGNVICVNLNTMKPVWHYDNHDDSDGTVVCRVEDGTPYIYTACEVDKQGDSGTCHFVKLKALTGQRIWERQIACQRVNLPGKTLDGGMYSTPLLGSGDCKDMIFANICRNGASASRGELTALSTVDGSVKYTVPYGNFCWSSPVKLLNERGQMFIFTGDASGYARLIEGKTGRVLCKKLVGANFESSPIIVGNAVVVGCRGTMINKFVIKKKGE
ncbi:MAG: PQQ-binding-like beta-propeller repeat protein [Prevotella sp.]|nr:PQQ-binding-like beta-propeller repeat protein [Prevotella sp.]